MLDLVGEQCWKKEGLTLDWIRCGVWVRWYMEEMLMIALGQSSVIKDQSYPRNVSPLLCHIIAFYVRTHDSQLPDQGCNLLYMHFDICLGRRFGSSSPSEISRVLKFLLVGGGDG